MYRPTWAEVSAGAFASNLRAFRTLVGPSVSVIAVLKADGYGHGSLPLARIAVENGAAGIGVSSIEEGLVLRDGGITAPILILGGLYPLENVGVALDAKLTPTISSLEAAEELAEAARQRDLRAGFHLKVDTGMGRIGVSPARAKTVLEWVSNQPSLRLEGVYSHFSCAESDAEASARQMSSFREVRHEAERRGFPEVTYHMANTAATLLYPDARFDAVRPGIGLYGLAPEGAPEIGLKPVLSWMTKIVFLKRVPAGTAISYGATYRTSGDAEIATLPVGYADGFSRQLSNRGHVLVRGVRRPVVGRVTMDHIMIDVTGLGAAVGDVVTLIGRQNDASIGAAEWAGWAGTISYEALCGISKRVPRVMTA